MTQPPQYTLFFIHACAIFVKSLSARRRIHIRSGGKHVLHLQPGGRRREDLHLGAEAEQPGIELRARDHVERNREMLRPVSDHDHVLAEAVEHRTDQMIGKAQPHRLLFPTEHAEYFLEYADRSSFERSSVPSRSISSAEISVILSTR